MHPKPIYEYQIATLSRHRKQRLYSSLIPLDYCFYLLLPFIPILFEEFLQLLQPLPDALYSPATLDDHRLPRLYNGQPKASGKPDREAFGQASPEVKFRVLKAPFKDKIKNDLVVICLQLFHD